MQDDMKNTLWIAGWFMVAAVSIVVPAILGILIGFTPDTLARRTDADLARQWAGHMQPVSNARHYFAPLVMHIGIRGVAIWILLGVLATFASTALTAVTAEFESSDDDPDSFAQRGHGPASNPSATNDNRGYTMTDLPTLHGLLAQHDELECQARALRQQMLPLLREAYPEVTTALDQVFGAAIDSQCSWLFDRKSQRLDARPVDACLAGYADKVHTILLQALYGMYV